MYDVDHINDPRGYYQARVAGREEELGVALAHVTPSAEGLRLIFVVPQAGMTLEAAQRWMSERLGEEVAYDGAVKDLARCSFLVPRDYILFIDEETLFGSHPVHPRRDAPQERPASADEGEAKTGDKDNEIKSGNEALSFKGIPYSGIIRQWLRLTGESPRRGSATPVCIASPRTCVTSRTTTRRCSCVSCPVMDWVRRRCVD